jgi:hypothetical protein
MRYVILTGLLVLAVVSAAAAGPTRRCAKLCKMNTKACKTTERSCRAEAKASFRIARGACATRACTSSAKAVRRAATRACRRDGKSCRSVPRTDCARAVKEALVEEYESLESCPLTPVPACAELEPTEECTDALHPADRFFWDTLHAGRYEDISEVLARLEAGLAERPGDPSLTRHIAWANVWRIGEAARGTASTAEVVASLAAARPGFALARTLQPDEPRILGFLASVVFAEGVVLGRQAAIDEGLALFEEAIDAWPDFNYFTAGYLMSQLPADSELFRTGLEYQWKNVDLCAGEVVDPQSFDYTKYLDRHTLRGRQRACWNSWIAPFNIEGFLMNLGDMMVKSGDWQAGVAIYGNARLTESYARWPFRAMLETRIQNAEANVAAFNSDPPVPGNTIMFSSPYSCMGCHQAG